MTYRMAKNVVILELEPVLQWVQWVVIELKNVVILAIVVVVVTVVVVVVD